VLNQWLSFVCGCAYIVFTMHAAPTTTVNDLPLGPGVGLLSSNADGLVALDKPVGVMAHPNRQGDCKRSLLNARYDYDAELYTWQIGGVQHRAWLINRLDSPTSGVILIALHEGLSATIKQLFAKHQVSKVYYALVHGKPAQPAGAWHDRLNRDVYRDQTGGGARIPAKARYQLVKQSAAGLPVSLLKLMPLTGRTHQLRMQCQHHGHPIVGDRTYGNFAFNREVLAASGVKRMLLHSGETRLRYVLNGGVRNFHAVAKLPDAFETVMCFRPGRHAGRGAKASATGTDSAQTALRGRRFKRQ
jgi:tRNA pseudouridine65 synthase